MNCSPVHSILCITNEIDYVLDIGSPDTTVLRMFVEISPSILTPLCVAEDPWQGEEFKVFLGCDFPKSAAGLHEQIKPSLDEAALQFHSSYAISAPRV